MRNRRSQYSENRHAATVAGYNQEQFRRDALAERFLIAPLARRGETALDKHRYSWYENQLCFGTRTD